MSLITPKKAASLLDVSERRLADWRQVGKGPRFVKLGDSPQDEVRYDERDVQKYIESRRRKHTNDPGPEVKKQRRRRKPNEAKAAA